MTRQVWKIGLSFPLGLALAFAGGVSVAMADPSPAPQVTTTLGAVRGVTSGRVDAFLGIPFAAPPVGPLRWRPPQPGTPWSGLRDATAYGHDCMQKPFASDAAPLGTAPDEDCLMVNVWRPHDPSAKSLPVMVWIYGGGFVNGGSSPEVYSGAKLAESGVVLVSFNYRLGRLGFFAHPALRVEHPEEPKGDYGIMDQVAALKWVRDNAKAFGGDPNNVTLFGESAGGVSVHFLMAAPQAQGLFQKAIIESGGGRNTLLGVRAIREDQVGAPSAETLGLAFARRKGVEGEGVDALTKLRQLPADQIIDGYNLASMFAGGPSDFAGPMVDGTVVRESPEAAYRAHHVAKVPLIVGANTADIGFSFAKSVEDALSPLNADHATALRAYDPEGTGNPTTIGTRVSMDAAMIEPARFVARAVAATGEAAYEYRFGYVAQSQTASWPSGAPHATEIPYVFDTVRAKYGQGLTDQDEGAAKLMSAYWLNFARHGDPNGAGLPTWPRHEAKTDQVMQILPDGTGRAGTDPWQARLDLTAAAAAAAASGDLRKTH